MFMFGIEMLPIIVMLEDMFDGNISSNYFHSSKIPPNVK